MIRVKRVYDEPDPSDGLRFLVDRLWPRGMKKEEARMDGWLKEVAPSDGLRRWFSHDPGKWRGFVERYGKELEGNGKLDELRRLSGRGTVTLLFSSRETVYNNANALKTIIEG